jgi:hypothetical protein
VTADVARLIGHRDPFASGDREKSSQHFGSAGWTGIGLPSALATKN